METEFVNENGHRETSEGGQGESDIVSENEIETSELNRGSEGISDTPLGVETGIVVNLIETQPSLDKLKIGSLENQQNDIQCLPGRRILNTLNKYLKNAMLSMLILIAKLPWNLTALYGFITNSGCENPTLKFWAELSFYCYAFLYMFLPYLIKIKLNRLSQ